MTRNVLGLGIALALAAACGPSRTTYQRYPGAPPAFDRAASNPQAVEIADKVLAAAGGAAAWDKARQIRWTAIKTEAGATMQGEQAWDRWNGRFYGKLETAEGSAHAAYEVFGTFSTAYFESKNGIKQIIEGSEKGTAITALKTTYALDVTVICMPFLLEEPGAKLEYVGLVKDGETEYHDVKVSFADPQRKELTFHAIVDKATNVIRRVDIEKGVEKIGYELSDWSEAGGLKFPTKRRNLGSGEISESKNFKVGEPDEVLYMRPITSAG